MKSCFRCEDTNPTSWKGRYCTKCASIIFREKHPDYQKNYRNDNLDTSYEWDKKYRNSTKGKETRTKYRKNNREKLNSDNRNRRSMQLEKYKEYDKKNKRTSSRRFHEGKRRAIKKNLTWTLTLEEFSKLIEMPCHYCNNLLDDPVKTGVGLDRIDNAKGYELDNVVSACRSCNVLRNDILTSEETEKVVKFVLQLRGIIQS